jgi:hypothetical protein
VRKVFILIGCTSHAVRFTVDVINIVQPGKIVTFGRFLKISGSSNNSIGTTT